MLTQDEFFLIIREQKYILDTITLGGFMKNNFELHFVDESYDFYNLTLDILKSGSIEIKHTIQKRAKTAIPILRLDVNAYHTNPLLEEDLINFPIDEKLLNLMKRYNGYNFKKETHLHCYIENFNDKWAFPPEEFGLICNNEFHENIKNFCTKFNIEATIRNEGLF